MRTSVFVVLVAATTSVVPRDTEACSEPVCRKGHFVPASDELLPENAPGVYWRPTRDNQSRTAPDPAHVRLVDTAAPDDAIAFTAQRLANGDFLLVPSSPLVLGHRYTITDRTPCPWATLPDATSTFSVTAAAPLPTELGALTGEPPHRSALIQGPFCWPDVDAVQSRIRLARSVDAAWDHLLHYETLVDGKPWRYWSAYDGVPGASVEGRGVDRVFAVFNSGEFTAATPGKHIVTTRATLPGTTLSIVSSAIELDLACDPQPDMPPTEIDGGEVRAGGCATTTGSARTGAAALAALAGMLASRRRKRSRR